MKQIPETRQTPVRDHCRVLVAGGGYAGVSAALAAARGGADVLLLEREYILGGLGTAGLITIYLPLCDGMGHQVSFGIAEELLRLVVRHGLEGELPELWFRNASVEQRKNGPRFMVRYNPQICALELERLLLENGVRILYGTSVCDVIKEGPRISAVVAENKSGRSAIEADCVVDCTGDADICHMAGAPTALFPDKNPMAAWYYYLQNGQLHLNSLGACDVTDEEEDPGALQRIGGSDRVSGVDAWENSRFLQAAHAEMLRDILARRGRGEDCVPVTMATIPQLRMTRRRGTTTCKTHDGDHSEASHDAAADRTGQRVRPRRSPAARDKRRPVFRLDAPRPCFRAAVRHAVPCVRAQSSDGRAVHFGGGRSLERHARHSGLRRLRRSSRNSCGAGLRFSVAGHRRLAAEAPFAGRARPSRRAVNKKRMPRLRHPLFLLRFWRRRRLSRLRRLLSLPPDPRACRTPWG